MLPLHKLILDGKVTDFEVKSDRFAGASQLPHSRGDLFEHKLDCVDVCETN